MNQEDLQQQINQYEQQQEIPNMWTRPESSSRHIFEVDPSPSRAYNKDTARGYLVEKEIISVKSNISLIAMLHQVEKEMINQAIIRAEREKISPEILEKEIETIQNDFERQKDYYRDEQSSTTVPSRSKRGFGMTMAKTDKRIQSSELNDMLIEDEKEFGDYNQPQNIGDKIRNAIPFIKRKEM
jgi:hypothetical protein